MPFAK
jgi:hypothetical protein